MNPRIYQIQHVASVRRTGGQGAELASQFLQQAMLSFDVLHRWRVFRVQSIADGFCDGFAWHWPPLGLVMFLFSLRVEACAELGCRK